MSGGLLIEGAKVFRHGGPWPGVAGSLHVVDGMIRAVLPAGANPPDRVKRVKLQGGVLIPAFFDAHLHLDQGGRYLGMLPLRDLHRPEDVLKAVATAEPTSGSPWVIGIGLHEEAWPPLDELHRASAGRACLLYTRDYHSAFVNRDAIRELGLTAQTSLPDGGWIDLDERGEPNGILHENAVMWAEERLPAATEEQKYANLVRAQDYLRSLGVLGVSDASQLDAWPVLREMEKRGELRLNVEHWRRCLDFNEDALAEERYRSDRLIRQRIKLFIDGALGSRTAWMAQEYSDSPGWAGEPVVEQGKFDRFVHRAAEAGWSLAVHAIGDAAVAHVTALLADLPAFAGSHRVEHVQHSDPETIRLLSGVELVSSVQPLHRLEDEGMLVGRIGVERTGFSYPMKSLLQTSGDRLVIGSDWPVVSADPRETMRAALMARHKRQGMPGEELTVEQALAAYTLHAAKAAGFDRFGALEAGYEASFLHLSNDPGRDPDAWGAAQINAAWERGA